MTDKLEFDINVSVILENGSDLRKIGTVLQHFTDKYLYIEDDKLFGVSRLSDIKPNHRFVCYDGGFQLVNLETNRFIYCFTKELSDYLTSNDNLLNNLTNVIIPPRMEPLNIETSDVAAQSRKNGTLSIIEAIRSNRNRNKKCDNLGVHLVPSFPNLPPKEKEEEVEWLDSDTDSEIGSESEPETESEPSKLCSVMANILRAKAAVKSKPIDIKVKRSSKNHSVNSGSVNSGSVNSGSFKSVQPEIGLQFPEVPRKFVDNVHLSSLPENLQKNIIKVKLDNVSKDIPIGTFYYNGICISVVNNNDMINVYDRENVLDADRLNPEYFDGEYDGTPGSLPIAQFKFHRYDYIVTSVDEPFSNNLIDKVVTYSPTLLCRNKHMVYADAEIISSEIFATTPCVRMILSVAKSKDCIDEPPSSWIVGKEKIYYRRLTPSGVVENSGSSQTDPVSDSLSETDSVESYMDISYSDESSLDEDYTFNNSI